MRRLSWVLVLVCLSTRAIAGDFIVGANSNVSLGNGKLLLNCSNLAVAGTFSAGTRLVDSNDVTINTGGTVNGQSADIKVEGDWASQGAFNPGTSSVSFIDGCANPSATISGSTNFFDLSLMSAIGKTYFMEAGSTQSISDFLKITGVSGNLINIRSTQNGVFAFTNLSGGQFIDFVRVIDNEATDRIIGPGPDVQFRSQDLGNTPGWFELLETVAIPALSILGFLLLTGVLLLVGGARLQPPRFKRA